MNKIEKYLRKLSYEDKLRISEVIDKLRSGKTAGLSVKKLGGYKDKFRARVGKSRIIYEGLGKSLKVLDIDKKDKDTYKFLD